MSSATAAATSPESPTVVDRLCQLLDEDTKEQQKTVANERVVGIESNLDKFWTSLGYITDARATEKTNPVSSLIRPITSNLYTCPLSAPQTMLVDYDALPLPVRSRVQEPAVSNTGRVVEIPLSYMIPGEEEGGKTDASATQLQSRPLMGNMTNKLKEYTRGVAGQTRPFRAGGGSMAKDDEKKDLADGSAAELFQSTEEIERHHQVLMQGAEASWKDGTILTAPPGASFRVGLDWNELYPENPIQLGEAGAADDERTSSKETASVTDGSHQTSSTSKPIATSGRMWERSYFDDDSLFGDSSSSSEEEEDVSEGDDDGESDTDEEERNAKPPKEDTPTATTTTPEPETVSTDADEVDNLLQQLSSTTPRKSSITSLPTNPNNPLKLAHQHAEMAQNTTRKQWANQTYLRIKDYGEFHTLLPNPALVFPFQLDDFQQQAVLRAERSESIFVAAHTSAGKTVCAEYAVALCRQHGTRAVYTSPIKALSNQKFRDFCGRFGEQNVGLVTGDMQLNVDDSTVLIMTTEILRSMLYRGADLIRDLEWVIFDEVHYINDSERGVVWEEVIIMLPQYVNMIFLSATTPNTVEFSDWIGRTKRKPIHVIRTSYRPVPLSHFLWAGLKLHKIMEGKSGFLDKGYKEASKALQPSKDGKSSKSKPTPPSRPTGSRQLAWQQQGNKNNWTSLVRFLQREGLTPTVIFSFSKKKCEEIAYMLRSLDLNTAAERGSVQGFAIQTVARLSPIDANLPQVLNVCDMVKRGIGVHHGGLLPILKEMVEILFSKNLIKVLFATETFAMGVNMPARAVVFNSIRKHDGVNFRELEPGEYVQMAGRAGRRGLDTVGTVILCCFGEVPPPLPILKTMLTGSSTRLSSQFRLTYNMILNLLRVEDMSVEGMIKRSFSEFATQRALTANEYPKLLTKGQKTLTKLQESFERDAPSRMGGAEDLQEYFVTSSALMNTTSELLQYILDSPGGKAEDVFCTGRILFVTSARKRGYIRAPALVLRAPSSATTSASALNRSSNRGSASTKTTICMVLLPESFVLPSSSDSDAVPSSSSISNKPGTVNFVGESKRRYYALHEISLDEILYVVSNKHKMDVTAVLKDDGGRSGGGHAGGLGRTDNMFGAAVGRRGGGDFDAFMGMKDRSKKSDDDNFFGGKKKKGSNEDEVVEQAMSVLISSEANEANSQLQPLDLRDAVKHGSDVLEFRKHCGKMEHLIARVRSFTSHTHPSLETHYAALERKETLRHRIDTLQHLLSNESLQLFPDFLQRKSVLRTLGYVDENEAVCVKGRVACEVNTCEELIVTEMVFEGILNELEPAEIVAALSALVYQGKNEDESTDAELPNALVECCERMKKVATNLGELQREHGLEVDPGEYCDNTLKFGLVHVVYEWALGVPFKSICELTLVQEGSIVRCITRLDELCREVRNCSRVVGNPTLYRKMEAASVAIKRDIVFASSLYVS